MTLKKEASIWLLIQWMLRVSFWYLSLVLQTVLLLMVCDMVKKNIWRNLLKAKEKKSYCIDEHKNTDSYYKTDLASNFCDDFKLYYKHWRERPHAIPAKVHPTVTYIGQQKGNILHLTNHNFSSQVFCHKIWENQFRNNWLSEKPK